MKLWCEVCATCKIGAAHLKGEKPKHWPSGERIATVQLVPVLSIVRPKLVGRTLPV
jgi:hypothetical protein